MPTRRAAPRHRLRDPARRPVPAPHDRRQHRHRPAAARLGQAAGARQRATELLERVGLPTELGRRYPAQLSGGQQQRVGVARALAADPPVMLMDEPFCAVDPVVRAELQDEFLRLQAELGKTIVFVTHDIDEAVKLGDEVARDARSAAGWPSAPPRPSCSRPRPTTSWPTSSAATAATGALGFHRGRRPAAGRGAHRRRSAPSRPRPPGRRPGRLGAGGRRRRSPAGLGRRAATRGRTRPSSRELLHRRRHGRPRRATRCAPRWTPRCPRRPAAASSSTATAGCSARSPPARCWSDRGRAQRGRH